MKMKRIYLWLNRLKHNIAGMTERFWIRYIRNIYRKQYKYLNTYISFTNMWVWHVKCEWSHMKGWSRVPKHESVSQKDVTNTFRKYFMTVYVETYIEGECMFQSNIMSADNGKKIFTKAWRSVPHCWGWWQA